MKVPKKIQPREKGYRRRPSLLRASLLRSERSERGLSTECGIHVQAASQGGSGKEPIPPLSNIVVGKIKCRFCIAAKELLADSSIEYAEAPVDLFPHLIPAGTKTVPVIYLNKKLIGGYGDFVHILVLRILLTATDFLSLKM